MPAIGAALLTIPEKRLWPEARRPAGTRRPTRTTWLTYTSAKETPSSEARTARTVGSETSAQTLNSATLTAAPARYMARRPIRLPRGPVASMTGISTTAVRPAAKPTRKGPPPWPTIRRPRKARAADHPADIRKAPALNGSSLGAARTVAPAAPRREPVCTVPAGRASCRRYVQSPKSSAIAA